MELDENNDSELCWRLCYASKNGLSLNYPRCAVRDYIPKLS